MTSLRDSLKPELPANLAESIPPHELMRTVFEAIDATSWPRLTRPEPGRASEAVLRTVLAYCYSIGVYSSVEVETMARRDPHVRYLCAGGAPAFDEIRHFRRGHVRSLRETLARVLHSTWLALRPAGPPVSLLPFVMEANDRLAAAIEADSAAMDF